MIRAALMDETNQLPFGSKLLRYFIYGVAFSTLFLVLAIIWIFVFFFLVIIGSFLGILIGIAVLFFFIGGLNTFLTRWIWSADIRSDLLSLFIHGVGLFVALLIASLPMFFLFGTPYSLALSIALFVPYALIDGVIAKNIAFALRKHTEPVFSTNVPSDRVAEQDAGIEHGTTKESSVEDEALEDWKTNFSRNTSITGDTRPEREFSTTK